MFDKKKEEKEVVIYEPPKTQLDRDIQDRDVLTALEEDMSSVKFNVEYHAKQYAKYKAKEQGIREEIQRLTERLDKSPLKIKEK